MEKGEQTMKIGSGRPGQGLAEYMLVIILVVIIVIAVLQVGGISVKSLFCKIAQNLNSQPAVCSTSLFQDDFNNLNQWQIINGKWVIKDGKLCGGPGGEGKIFAPIPGAKNYVVSLKGAKLDSGNGYGLFFRANNFQNVSGYDFQYDPGFQGYIFREWYNGYEYAPPSQGRYTLNNANYYSQAHDIKMVVQDSTYTAYVDDQKVYSVTDPTYSQGGIGLRVWDSTTVCFDSIQVDPIP
jgi:hypothetical protein